MDRETIFSLLQAAEPELKNRGVESLAVFGSVARGDHDAGSDLDILVDFSRPVGLFEFIRLKAFLERITNCRVDLVTRDAIRPELREAIIKEAVDVR